jgi:methyl-accepting chemotaxis protein
VTQQNAANAEESASAAEQLSSQASELKNMVLQFHLSKRRESTPIYGKTTTTTEKLKVTPERRSPANTNPPKPKASIEVKPDKVLPLDSMDDDDFDDFK